MRTIWKFVCEPQVRHRWKATLPADFKVIHLAHNSMWIEASHKQPVVTTEVLFAIIGTGHDIPENFVHAGTWLSGSYVWHLYMLRAGTTQ